MAYKDEYEVARLHLSPRFDAGTEDFRRAAPPRLASPPAAPARRSVSSGSCVSDLVSPARLRALRASGSPGDCRRSFRVAAVRQRGAAARAVVPRPGAGRARRLRRRQPTRRRSSWPPARDDPWLRGHQAPQHRAVPANGLHGSWSGLSSRRRLRRRWAELGPQGVCRPATAAIRGKDAGAVNPTADRTHLGQGRAVRALNVGRWSRLVAREFVAWLALATRGALARRRLRHRRSGGRHPRRRRPGGRGRDRPRPRSSSPMPRRTFRDPRARFEVGDAQSLPVPPPPTTPRSRASS